ncbi:hypothetical protein IB238_03995 [Rhizobium sp. ARZ01]|nr:hypothetical protein [Rhizobium sp. ARZ01]MBD9371802.1 hypothetical protein [Rhizobium sp. ARZ01]
MASTVLRNFENTWPNLRMIVMKTRIVETLICKVRFPNFEQKYANCGG